MDDASSSRPPSTTPPAGGTAVAVEAPRMTALRRQDPVVVVVIGAAEVVPATDERREWPGDGRAAADAPLVSRAAASPLAAVEAAPLLDASTSLASAVSVHAVAVEAPLAVVPVVDEGEREDEDDDDEAAAAAEISTAAAYEEERRSYLRYRRKFLLGAAGVLVAAALAGGVTAAVVASKDSAGTAGRDGATEEQQFGSWCGRGDDGAGVCWHQLGPGLEGSAPGEGFAAITSLSHDGSRLLVSSIFALDVDEGGDTVSVSGAGLTRVYDVDRATGSLSPLGQDLYGLAEDDSLLPDQTLAVLSSNGERLVQANLGSGWSGFVRPGTGGEGWFDPNRSEVAVWELTDSSDGDGGGGLAWSRVGEPLRLEGDERSADDERFGFPFSASGDGTVVAAGSYSPDRGIRLHVYEETDATAGAGTGGPRWRRKGSAVAMDLPYNRRDGLPPGWWIDLAEDGATVIVGMFLETVENRYGHVRVFRYDPDLADWTQKGGSVEGTTAGEAFGLDVALSADGGAFVAGGPGEVATGQIGIFRWDDVRSDWFQLGNYLSGNVLDSIYVAEISADGRRVATVARNDNGYAWVYDYDENIDDWKAVGGVIEGPKPNIDFGFAVSLSSDGSLLVVSGPAWRNGEESGSLRLYQLKSG